MELILHINLSKRYSYSERLLDDVQYFKTVERKKVSVMLPKNWKESFSSGIIIPTELKR